MNSEASIPRLHEDLELNDGETKLTALTFGINLYTNKSFYSIPAETLQTFDHFLQLCPAKQLNFYATETMKEHKPVTKRALGMLGTWLAPDAPPKPFIALELKSSPTPQDAPHLKYEVWSDHSSQSNIISMAFPSSWAQEKPDEMLEFVVQLAENFPFRSGLAGYSFECSRYNKRKSETHAWSTSMRHPGIDIVRIPVDAKAAGIVESAVHSTAPIGSQGIRGVGWLTLLDAGLIKDLGGLTAIRKQLSDPINIIECKHGIILKAGATPSLGDINRGETLPLYKEVYRLLAPWISIAAEMSMSFQLVNEYVERTNAWYARFGK